MKKSVGFLFSLLVMASVTMTTFAHGHQGKNSHHNRQNNYNNESCNYLNCQNDTHKHMVDGVHHDIGLCVDEYHTHGDKQLDCYYNSCQNVNHEHLYNNEYHDIRKCTNVNHDHGNWNVTTTHNTTRHDCCR